GGEPVNGVVTLTGAAPSGGAVVSLSANDPLSVAATVSVPAGDTKAVFAVGTRAVGGTINATVTASYGAATQTPTITLTRPRLATARFGVTGQTTDTCAMTDAGTALDCVFNGSTSSAPGNIVSWEWSWGVTTMLSATTTGPVLSKPTANCSMIPLPPL